ncbi:m7GpppX diphosphatase-like, partial [Ruditapes philippinarum]|uniref:m7GpppX diphosphatase-like n=1 Tax=Ruditapes philippinarum TaxID=129788 RepID=UPI00295A81A5
FQNVNASFDKNKTLDVVIFEDADLETGFSLNQVYNIRKADNSDLYLVVIARKLGIKSLRDLDTSSLPLLMNILGKGQTVVMDRFGISPSKLNMFVLYQPPYYHFHVIFKHVELEDPLFTPDSAHLLTDVIDNIKLMGDYYKKKSITFVNTDHDMY